MKIFWTYWKRFHKELLPKQLYLGVGLWIFFLFVFNYNLDFEDSVIDRHRGEPVRWLYYILYNGIGYLGALALVVLGNNRQLRLSRKFWWLIGFGLIILAFDRSAYQHFNLIRPWVPPALFKYTFKAIGNVQSLVSIIFLLWLLFLWHRPGGDFGFYGLRRKGVNFKVYGLLFLLMVPVIGIACLMPDIQSYYPAYLRSGGDQWAAYLGISELWAILLFEFVYLIDFISVELFFRGFLVIGLCRYLGKAALLPMITLYAMLHFGKPIGEAISSVFGGYILGVLAYETKNIYGGIVLHGGIAILMEIFAAIW